MICKMQTQVFLCVFLTTLLMSVSSEEYEDWNPEKEECVNKHELNKEEIQKLDEEAIVPEDNDGLNTFLTCYYTKKDVLNEKGAIDFDNLQKEFLNEYKKIFGKNPDIPSIIAGGLVKTAINDCGQRKIEGSTPGQTLAKVQNCVAEKVFKDIEEGKESETPKEA